MKNWVHRLLGGLAGKVIRGMSRRRLPAQEGEMVLEGLSGQVEIRRDPRGVPYIYADNKSDLFFAQGYVHAQDRLWQMEINRRIANGQLSEVLGSKALDTDRLSRTLGFARNARKDLQLIPKEMVSHLEAYCAGINAYLQTAKVKLPVEFSLLKFEPATWTPVDVLSFSRLMTLQLSHGWGHEIARAHLIEALGEDLARELDLRHHPETPATLPDGVEFNYRHPDGRLEAFEGPYLKPFGGSNAWVVSGERSDTGKPYLCNDPHLSLLAPSVWYQIYLEGGGFRAQGVCIPGMPLVMIGHNAHISWGITLAFTDIQDVFVEQFLPGEKTKYLHKEEVLEAEVFPEVIEIKGGGTWTEEVLVTRNGPVISGTLNIPLAREPHFHYSLSSPALKPSRLTMGWYLLDQARDWNEFVGAMKFIEAPGLNVVYADKKGNIGYWVTGKTPIRAKGTGEVPQPGWTGEHDWVGHVPFESMPHVFNPQSGYVISANHKIVDDDFPYFMGNIWMNGYRARRIRDLLESEPKWGKEGFARIQNDLFCIPGHRFASYYRTLGMGGDARLEQARQLLANWNGILTPDSIGGALYEVARKEVVWKLVGLAAGEEGTYHFLIGMGVHPLFFRVNEFQGKDTNALMDLLENPDSQLIRKAGGRDLLLQEGLRAAVTVLEEALGKDMARWEWGRLHLLEFKHAMATRKPLDKAFNIGPIPMAGDTDTVCQTSMQPESGYLANLAAPSYRQIIDLEDFSRSWWVMPPGQSGHRGSPQYEDQVQPWLEGRYFPMMWDREQVEKGTPLVQFLKPSGSGK